MEEKNKTEEVINCEDAIRLKLCPIKYGNEGDSCETCPYEDDWQYFATTSVWYTNRGLFYICVKDGLKPSSSEI